MSRVFVAEETALGRPVVVKVLPPELGAAISMDRFRREIQVAASLQHPHIVPLLAAGRADDLLYYTMPLVEGESLRARLAREGELPVPEAVRILRDVADALGYAHRHGVVHRDIKPDNVLLSNHHALVTDFGVAKALDRAARDSSLTATGLALGTPAYMAPEQAAGDPNTDQRADIYALGVLAYEMLAGRPPFTGPSPRAIVAAHLTQPPVPLVEARDSVPRALGALVMRCLEKRPADRWHSAAELVQAVEALAAPSVDLPAGAARPSPRRTPRRRTLVLLAAGAVLLVAAVAWAIARRTADAGPLDADLVAVAPFDVPDAGLSLWREGLVDLLSRNLDGAGPLRSVPPTTVIRRWSGRADRLSAAALGRQTGARVVVFGSLIGAGPDSARLTVTVLDAGADRPFAEIELRESASRMDRLADSLTVRLLRELGRSRNIQVLRTASLGSTSLPALKAFLQGEQWFRRAAWDSALASYEQAIALDSSFPLALRRAGQVLGWQRTAFDSLSEALALRAGSLNRGLAPRDSLLVTADSVLAAIYSQVPAVDWPLVRRAHEVTRELTRRYPEDFESWFAVGEARYHVGSPAGTTPREALDAFDRAIASDSSFAPAYIHAIELALWLEGPEAGRRYAREYLELAPTDVAASGIGLVERILSAGPQGRSDIQRLLRGAAPSALADAWIQLRRVVDSAESDIAVARALAAAGPGDAAWLGREGREHWLSQSLLYRGHVREATVRLLEGDQAVRPLRWVETALLSPAAGDRAAAVFRQWLASDSLAAPVALPFWLGRKDSASIRELQRRTARIADSSADRVVRSRAAYFSEAALAYLTLLRGDTTSAITRLEILPDSLCPYCYFQRLTLAQLLSARQENRKAAALLDRWLSEFLVPSEVLWTLERARVAERLADREKAARDYQYVVNAWRHADPELQPYVAEAREGLARVTTEPRN